MAKDERAVIEDELLSLWAKVPLRPHHLEQSAPRLITYLSPTDNSTEALVALLTLLIDLGNRSKEGAAIAAALGVGVDESFNVENRLVTLADEFGSDASRTSRRWARSGAEQLADLIVQPSIVRPGIQVELVQSEDGEVTASVGYDSDEGDPLSWLFILINRETFMDWRIEEDESGEMAEVADVPVPFFSDGTAELEVAWVGLIAPTVLVVTQLQEGFGLATSMEPNSVRITIAANPA